MGEAGQATRDSIPDSGSILKYCLVMEFGLLDRDPNRPACSCGIGNKLCLYVDFRNYPPVDLAKIQECPEAKDKGLSLIHI